MTAREACLERSELFLVEVGLPADFRVLDWLKMCTSLRDKTITWMDFHVRLRGGMS
jgi:hypothetical protein